MAPSDEGLVSKIDASLELYMTRTPAARSCSSMTAIGLPKPALCPSSSTILRSVAFCLDGSGVQDGSKQTDFSFKGPAIRSAGRCMSSLKRMAPRSTFNPVSLVVGMCASAWPIHGLEDAQIFPLHISAVHDKS